MDARFSELRRVKNRELEIKRINGDISCAECRRLKLKCDRKVPCSSCVRRECQEVCPTGSLGTSNRRGSHQSTVELSPGPSLNEPDFTQRLIKRVRALEDALQIATDSSHPLLSAELLSIKQGSKVVEPEMEYLDGGASGDESEMIDAFGTLTLGEGNTQRFLGAIATEGVLLMNAYEPMPDPRTQSGSAELPPSLSQASEMWPFAPAYLSNSAYISQIVTYLPPYERVKKLVDEYFQRFSWFIDRSQVADDLIPLFYPNKTLISPSRVHVENMHDIALLFMVLAGGVLGPTTNPSNIPEAERFKQLACAALTLYSVLDHASLSACQVLLILGSYEAHLGHKWSQERSWKIMMMAFCHAVSIGLHRDPSHWKLDHKMVERRRRIFWEINTVEKWRCLGSGRPAFFTPDMVDCEFPFDYGATLSADGEKVESVWHWRYRFTEVVTRLTEKLCSARPPKYSEITKLDKLIRDFDIHPLASHATTAESLVITDGEYRYLHPLLTAWWKERALLTLHRGYFARAILEYPNQPMRSPFAVSFLSAFKSAKAILALVRGALERRRPIEAKWPLWAMSLSAAIIVGSVAARVKQATFAVPALEELEKAIVIFEKYTHPVAYLGVALLQRLRKRAKAAITGQPLSSRGHSCSGSTEAESSTSNHSSHSPIPSVQDENDEYGDELLILRGTTRRISSPNPSLSLPPATSTSSSGRSPELHPAPTNDPASSLSSSTSQDSFAQSSQNYTSNIFGGSQQAPSNSIIAQPYTQVTQYPSGLGSANRDPQRAREWMAAVERNRAAAFASQVVEQQKQYQTYSGKTQAGWIESIVASSGAYNLDPSIHMEFSAQNNIPGINGKDAYAAAHNHSVESRAHPFTPFDFTLGPSSNIPGPFDSDPSIPQNTIDFDVGLPGGDTTASAVAWHSFMQEFNLTSDVSMDFENWEAMSSFA